MRAFGAGGRRPHPLPLSRRGPKVGREGSFSGVRLQHLPPIVADVVVQIGMGLHEDQVGATRRRGQFVGHPGAAIFLLRGGDQQHVALRQDRPQPRQVAAERAVRARGEDAAGVSVRCSVFLRRVRIGTIDQHQVAQRRQIALDQFHRGRVDAEHLGRQAGTANERGPGGGGPRPAGLHHFRPDDRIHQRTLPGAGAAEGGHDQRGVQPHPQRRRPIRQPPHQRPALLGRLPGGRIAGPPVEPVDQRVDLGQQFQVGQFRSRHRPAISR